MRRERRHVTGASYLRTWKDQPEYRAANDGWGLCNTGGPLRIVCPLGAIGCDVDHVAIAREMMATLRAQVGT